MKGLIASKSTKKKEENKFNCNCLHYFLKLVLWYYQNI